VTNYVALATVLRDRVTLRAFISSNKLFACFILSEVEITELRHSRAA